jgi:hypothetical protein
MSLVPHADSHSGRAGSDGLIRAASRARIANFRRDSARRSYRSNAGSRRAISERIEINLSGPSSFDSSNLTSSAGISSHRQHLWIMRSAAHTFSFQFARESKSGSASAREMRSRRRDRTRRRSICDSATRRASSWISGPAFVPAIWPPSAATCRESVGSERTDRLSPWRSGFLADRVLPLAVFGPVLNRALARFDQIWRVLVIRPRLELTCFLSREADRHSPVPERSGVIFCPAFRDGARSPGAPRSGAPPQQ